ncbi:ATP-binding protein [Thermodesulfobacteriota bacterium]
MEQLSRNQLEMLYKKHLRGAKVRSWATGGMWIFALAAFWAGIFNTHQFWGITSTMMYLILINPPTLFVLKHIVGRKAYEYFSLIINELEIIGYTAAIYFAGGIDASYLVLIYAVLITYIGVVAGWRHLFIIASLCAGSYNLMVALVYFGFLPKIYMIEGYTIPGMNQLLIATVVTAYLYVGAFISATTANLLKKNKNKLRDQNFKLKSTNEELTREIEERKLAEKDNRRLESQLRRAQKMEALGTLAGGVAHDLNNVLSGLVSYPDLLLLQVPADSPMREPLTTVQKSGKKAAAIVQDLLTLARRGVPTKEVVNLNDIISEYMESPEFKKLKTFHPNAEIEADLAENLLNVSGSPIHLGKTVMNLVSNAAEAIDKSGKIIISTENKYIDSTIQGYDDVAEGEYVVVSVSDSGTGISPDDLESIFEPFYTKKKMGRSGTGLGMAVVWGTIKDHNGYIDVQSTEGEGSSFTLYFPSTKLPSAKHLHDLKIDNYMGNGSSILVVDDIEEQREIASSMLTQLGYKVTSVSCGEEALVYLKKTTIDLVVLDMIMDPGIDGLDTYKKILDIHPDQNAIITSGFSETARIREAQRLGVGRYLSKPYSLEGIGTAVKAELDK